MIYDCFTFFNELDLLEIRLNTLAPIVDFFVIAEATRTHRGEKRDLVFAANRARFAAFLPKIKYIVVDDLLPAEEIAKDAFNLAWINENRQRNALKRGIVGATAKDIIMVSDLDEIPRPEKIPTAVELARKGEIVRMVEDVFVYYANFKDFRSPKWYLGTQVLTVETFNNSPVLERVRADRYKPESENRGRSFNKIRFARSTRKIDHAGWHMTYLGGAKAIAHKLKSFSHVEASPLAALAEARLAAGVNIFGGRRDAFGVEIGGTFPRYLVENQEKFAKIIFPVTQEYLEKTRLGRRLAALRGHLYRATVALVPSFLIAPLSGIYRRLRFR